MKWIYMEKKINQKKNRNLEILENTSASWIVDPFYGKTMVTQPGGTWVVGYNRRSIYSSKGTQIDDL